MEDGLGLKNRMIEGQHRKPPEARRSESFLLRLTPSERERVRSEARRLGVSDSDVLRLMLRESAPELTTR